MPVEIRELVIRAEVEPRKGEGRQPAQDSGAPAERELFVRDCVEQVMEIIRQKEER